MEPAPELENLILHIYEIESSRDTAALVNLISHQEGTLLIGTDPDEWWQGFDTIDKVYQTQAQEIGAVQIIAGDPKTYREGTVGWVSDRASLELPDGREFPLRVTTVFHKEGGEW
jgi:hypothetical protein